LRNGDLEKAWIWTTVSRPPDENFLGSKWVFRIKHNADGPVDKHKACLVAKVFMQVHRSRLFRRPPTHGEAVQLPHHPGMLHATTGTLESSRTRMFVNASSNPSTTFYLRISGISYLAGH